MKRNSMRVLSSIALVIVCAGGAAAQRAPGGPPRPSEFDAYCSLGPDSLPRDGVPKGEVRGPFKLASAAYPGAEHSYWVYVPAQYDAAREASLMVFQDGATYLKADGFYRAQNVLDNLVRHGRAQPQHGRCDAAGDDALVVARPAGVARPARHEGACVSRQEIAA